MFDPLIRLIRDLGSMMALVVIVGIIMLAFGLGESALAKLFGSSVLGLFLFIRYFGAGALERKVGTIVEDKANSIFGHLDETEKQSDDFDADEAFANYMRKRDAGLTEPPPPDVGAIRNFGRKGQ